MKKVFLSIVCLLAVITLSGCMKKDVITTEKFKSEATELGYNIYDITDQFGDYEYVKEVTIAMKNNDYQVEFYVFESDKDAKQAFERNKEFFDSQKEGTYSDGQKNMVNYSTYRVSSNNEYMYVSRVENTLLYLHIPDTYKKEATTLIDKLGY